MPSLTNDVIRGVSASVAIKAPVRAATTANVTLSGTQTIDGVAVVADDRVLVKDQTDASENGIYVASASAWSRAKDFDGSRDAVTGTLVYVRSGTDSGDRFARLTTADSVDIGTDDLTWEIVNGPGLGTISAFASTLLDDADAATARATLGAGTGNGDVSSSRTITAGSGLSGGGDLSANRTLSLDINGLSSVTPAIDDTVAVSDTSDSNNPKKVSVLALINRTPFATYSNTQTSGTAGGSTSALAWSDCVINTEDVDADAITIGSLGANTITLFAGTYEVDAWQVLRGNATAMAGKIRLRDISNSVTVANGLSVCMSGATNDGIVAIIPKTQFTLGGAAQFKLQYWVSIALATSGLGAPATTGESEKYAQVNFRRIA